MTQKTEGLLVSAQNAMDKAEGVQSDFAHIHSLKGIGLALMACAQELKLANDLKMWELGCTGPTKEWFDYGQPSNAEDALS